MALLLGLAAPLWAQAPSRQQLVEKALAKSHAVQIQQYKATSAGLDKQRARLTYVPKVGLTGAYMRLLNQPTIYTSLPGQLKPALMEGFHSLGPALKPILTNPQLGPVLAPLLGQLGEGLSNLPDRMGISLPDNNIMFFDLHADMVLFTGFKAPLMAKAAGEKQQAETELVAARQQAVIEETLDYYDRMAVLEQSDKVLQENRKRLEQQTAYALKAKEVGLAVDYDLSKVRIAQQELKAKQIELDASRSLLLSKLEQLTGMERDTLAGIRPELQPLLLEEQQPDVQSRPEVRALSHGVQALEYVHQSEKLEFLPKAKAFAHVLGGTTSHNSIDPVAMVGVGLKWEIFDGMQRRKLEQKSELEMLSMQAQKAQAEELVLLDFENNKKNYLVTTQLIAVAQEKMQESRLAMEIRQKELESGLSDINDRLAADAEYTHSQLAYLQAVYQQRKAAVALLKAAGTLNPSSVR